MKTTLDNEKFAVLTDKTDANRVYDPKGAKFKKYDDDSTIVDKSGKSWVVDESWFEAKNGAKLERLPDYRAFWLACRAAFSETKRIK